MHLFSPIHDYSKYCNIFYFLSMYSFFFFVGSLLLLVVVFFSKNHKINNWHTYLTTISTALTYLLFYLVHRTLYSMCVVSR